MDWVEYIKWVNAPQIKPVDSWSKSKKWYQKGKRKNKTKKFLLPYRLYFGIDVYRCNKIIKEIYINIVTKLNARVHIFKHIEKNRGQDIKTVIWKTQNEMNEKYCWYTFHQMLWTRIYIHFIKCCEQQCIIPMFPKIPDKRSKTQQVLRKINFKVSKK